MIAMAWWAKVLIGWGVLSAVVAVPIGKLLKRSRERVEAEEEFWKDQKRRSVSRWN